MQGSKIFWAALFLVILAQGQVLVGEKVNIVCPETAGAISKVAAQELAVHLKLLLDPNQVAITASAAEQKYNFYVGTEPANSPLQRPPVPEEAFYLVSKDGTWFWGEDSLPATYQKKKTIDQRSLSSRGCRTGTLFAVYDFLDKQLGIRWISPGDEGIVLTQESMPELKEGFYSWNPGQLKQRFLRCGMPRWTEYQKTMNNYPAPLVWSEAELESKASDAFAWLKRHKMGNSFYFGYGHAFTNWWKLYGKEHPEYFAMQSDGVRRPEHAPDRCKLCVSNPAVTKQIVENWLKGNPRAKVINVCENDSGGYCRCPECLALDVPTPGEEFDHHLTDRYVWFANSVLREASKHDPEVLVSMYAYSRYSAPPRREKVMDRVIIGFVPSGSPEEVAQQYEAWRKAGVKQIFYRPNSFHLNTGLPMGFEEQLYEYFQVGMKYGIMGTDYDTLHHYWPATGLADYVVARLHTRPEMTFEQLEDEYCSAWGAAAPQAKAYWRYWRNNVYYKRVIPNMAAIRERGRYGNFRRGLMWDIDKYYLLEDFDKTDAILAQADKSFLTARQLQRLEALQLANQHARLMFLALTAKDGDRLPRGRDLLNFRIKHRDDLQFSWTSLMYRERDFGDVANVMLAWDMRDYQEIEPTPLYWQFKMDPEDKGLLETENWPAKSWSAIRKDWPMRLRTDRCWESQMPENVPEEAKAEIKAVLENYDGIAFYATALQIPESWKGKEIFLRFGAVDESAWVYVNGKLAGEHIYKNPDDWILPFEIPITDQIDWQSKRQTVVVRVRDTAGAGGIWKAVHLGRK